MKKPFTLLAGLIFFAACQSTPAEVLSFADLQYTLPADWSIEKEMTGAEGVKWATLSIPDPEHQVSLKIIVTEEMPAEGAQPIQSQEDTHVYAGECGGGFACYHLEMGEYDRFFAFQIESTQAMPEDYDGVWVPDTTLTREELIDFLLTAELVD